MRVASLKILNDCVVLFLFLFSLGVPRNSSRTELLDAKLLSVEAHACIVCAPLQVSHDSTD